MNNKATYTISGFLTITPFIIIHFAVDSGWNPAMIFSELKATFAIAFISLVLSIPIYFVIKWLGGKFRFLYLYCGFIVVDSLLLFNFLSMGSSDAVFQSLKIEGEGQTVYESKERNFETGVIQQETRVTLDSGVRRQYNCDV